METMRVYEFSKKYGVPNKELLAALRAAGFEVGSHMSMLSDKELDFLLHTFRKPVAPKKESKEKKTPEKRKKTEKEQPVIDKIERETTSPSKPIPPQTIRQEEKKVKPVPVGVDKEEEAPAFIIEPMSLVDFAEKVHKPASEIILTLLKLRIVATKNQMLKEDVVNKLVSHYQIKAQRRVEEMHALQDIAAREGVFQERPPVVVVLGHVDHGKTTLLDFIRKTRVAAKEKGGITQHLGAYKVPTAQGNIIFLDTPGHEAFTKIRGRSVGVADIAILIIAADDGIMPQTMEAIKFAKAANIPIIVAINKVDKVDPSRIEAVKQELAQQDLLPEDWGGEIVCMPISAKLGTGIDQLLEMIILQSQLMELRADEKGPGIGHVLESKLERGRGPVATVLSRHGAIKIGDYFICSNTVGKVNSLIDSSGERLRQVGPATPVQVAGFDELPAVGSIFKVVSLEEYRRIKSALKQQKTVLQKFISEGAINLLIKTDTLSSKEALLGALDKLAKKLDKNFNIVFAGIGAISEGDVVRASTTNADIIALHVKSETNAALLARHYDVSLRIFDIIYKLIEDLEETVKKAEPVELVTTKIGEAVVRQVFSIKNIGVIAGCYVKDGRFTRDGFVVVWRGKQKIGEGKITSLQRERKPVKEVHTGFECGFVAEGLNDYAIDDRVECFIKVPSK